MMMLAFDVELCECGSGNMNDGNDREGRRRGQIHEPEKLNGDQVEEYGCGD